MTQQETQHFEARIAAIETRIDDMRAHLREQSHVDTGGLEEMLSTFFKRSQTLKHAETTDHEAAKELEHGLESWISDIDKEYGSPPKRVQSVSM